MNADDIRKQSQRHGFINNNGMILRMLNILDGKEQNIGSIRYIMHETPLEELRNSFHYLNDSGYIRIRHPDGAACIGQDKDVWSGVRMDITRSGMELLMGITDNPAVDV